MSQYTYRHKKLAILAGWDRPLQYHFLVVERPGRNGDDILYSNLSDPTLPGGAMTAAQVIAKLRELEIPYPALLEVNLREDQHGNVGNHVRDYGEL